MDINKYPEISLKDFCKEYEYSLEPLVKNLILTDEHYYAGLEDNCRTITMDEAEGGMSWGGNVKKYKLIEKDYRAIKGVKRSIMRTEMWELLSLFKLRNKPSKVKTKLNTLVKIFK